MTPEQTVGLILLCQPTYHIYIYIYIYTIILNRNDIDIVMTIFQNPYYEHYFQHLLESSFNF